MRTKTWALFHCPHTNAGAKVLLFFETTKYFGQKSAIYRMFSLKTMKEGGKTLMLGQVGGVKQRTGLLTAMQEHRHVHRSV